MSASKNILIEGALFASTINNYERFTNLYHLNREQWGIEPFGRERNKAHDCLLVEITVTFLQRCQMASVNKVECSPFMSV